jgi:hypothetical protein
VHFLFIFLMHVLQKKVQEHDYTVATAAGEAGNHLTLNQMCQAVNAPDFPDKVPAAQLTAQQLYLWAAHEVLSRVSPPPEVGSSGGFFYT